MAVVARKPYATPVLIAYGSVSELTGQRRLRSTVGNGAFDLAYSP